MPFSFTHSANIFSVNSPPLSVTKTLGSPFLATISLEKASQTMADFLEARGIASAQPVNELHWSEGTAGLCDPTESVQQCPYHLLERTVRGGHHSSWSHRVCWRQCVAMHTTLYINMDCFPHPRPHITFMYPLQDLFGSGMSYFPMTPINILAS